MKKPMLRWRREEAQATEHRQFGDAALIVAGLTGLAYGLAYAFEAGYCGYFGIPAFLINPSTSVVVGAVLAMVALASTFLGLVAVERAWLRHILNLPDHVIFRLEVWFLLSVFGIAAYGMSWGAAGNAAVLFVLLLLDYGPGLFTRKGPWRKRLDRAAEDRNIVLESNPLIDFFSLVGENVANFIVFVFFSCLTAVNLGTASARIQDTFNVLEARPDVAFVKAYGDLYIGIKFDPEKHTATGEIVLFKLGDEFKQVNFVPKRIGPLTPFHKRTYWGTD